MVVVVVVYALFLPVCTSFGMAQSRSKHCPYLGWGVKETLHVSPDIDGHTDSHSNFPESKLCLSGLHLDCTCL